MCLNPTYIDNPYFGENPKKYFGLKDTISKLMPIPCKTCSECIALEQMYLVQRIQMEALNNWLFMGTVTYKNETIPKLTTSQDYEYRFTDIKDINACIKRLRSNNTFSIPFRHIYVSERGGKGGRPHAHFLFIFRKQDIGKDFSDAYNFAQEHQWDLFNEWKRVTKKGRYSESIQLSDYRESIRYGIKHKTYDFHFVDARLTNSGITDVAFYVLKYMLKGTPHEKKIQQALKLNYDENESKTTWQIIKSKQIHSHNFGLNVWPNTDSHDYTIIEYLRKGIEESKRTSNFPLYYCPEQILTFPLAPYYKQNALIYDMKDARDFLKKSNSYKRYGYQYIENDKDIREIIQKMNDYERKLKIIEQDVVDTTLEELYN